MPYLGDPAIGRPWLPAHGPSVTLRVGQGMRVTVFRRDWIVLTMTGPAVGGADAAR